ncbi:MAG: class I SAM-dependent methyltransferase [Lachnospiraceae bacterium]|nr:class I SAM-dependent methyltransferase [Lachnospiraceae bacterium]
MDNRNELGGTFDTESVLYDKMRPGYVEGLYQTIFDYINIDENSRVIEVGSGTGQATGPVLKKGCELTAVEYGENLSRILKEKFGSYERFSAITSRFEDLELEENAYDLIFSATAFHWIPEETGYPKVFSLLKPGGAFARFANRPHNSKRDPDLAHEIDALYDFYYNDYYDIMPGTKKRFTEDKANEIAMIPSKYGFTDMQYHLFYRERVFDADEYIKLLGTYSDHIAIAEPIRNEFFAKIAKAINEHGGSITISDTLDLELARKPL